jgi:aromatic-L-amino-acid/L-tryptophan decarboxylase
MEERKYLDSAQQPTATGDMDPESFRMYGHQVVDWIADYLEHAKEYPVLAQTAPGDIRHALPDKPPVEPESMETILTDFDRIIMPGITHWNSPGFLAYFGITGSGPGILGEMLSGALNVNAMLWRTSPAATELEQVTLDWLRQMLQRLQVYCMPWQRHVKLCLFIFAKKGLPAGLMFLAYAIMLLRRLIPR